MSNVTLKNQILYFKKVFQVLSFVFVIAPKTNYPAQFKELKNLIETTNTNVNLRENRITTNHEKLMARVCNGETQVMEALDLATKNEIIIN